MTRFDAYLDLSCISKLPDGGLDGSEMRDSFFLSCWKERGDLYKRFRVEYQVLKKPLLRKACLSNGVFSDTNALIQLVFSKMSYMLKN